DRKVERVLRTRFVVEALVPSACLLSSVFDTKTTTTSWSTSIETADRNRCRCVFGNRRDTRSRDESGAPAEISLCNSDRHKRSAAGKFALRTADCDSALRQRSLNRDTPRAIPGHAARFGVHRFDIARAK